MCSQRHVDRRRTQSAGTPAVGMRTQTDKPAPEGHMEGLTETLFFWAECGYRTLSLSPQVSPDPLGAPQWATWTHGHTTLPAGPLPITSSVLLSCSWLSVPCHSPRLSLLPFLLTLDLFLLPKPLANSASLHSSLWPISCRLHYLHLYLQVSLWLCLYITLLPLLCPAFSPAILSLCLQPLHPSGVVPHL